MYWDDHIFSLLPYHYGQIMLIDFKILEIFYQSEYPRLCYSNKIPYLHDLKQDFSHLTLYTVWFGWFFIAGCCSVPGRMFSSITGLYPLYAVNTYTMKVVATKNCQTLPNVLWWQDKGWGSDCPKLKTIALKQFMSIKNQVDTLLYFPLWNASGLSCYNLDLCWT